MTKKILLATLLSVGTFITSNLLADGPVQVNQPVTFELQVEPKAHLTKDWVFVVDTSHSMNRVFYKAQQAFFQATKSNTDELHFCVITFNNEGMEAYRDWADASEEEFRKADDWVEKEMRVLSYGSKALEMALKLNRHNVSMMLITDGGFTEACYNRGFGRIRQVIEQNQAWRAQNGLEEEIICALGIENPYYHGGGKPSDIECQAFMREVGSRWNGGYLLVRNAMPAPHQQAQSGH